ncbi:reverse transcriptase [Verticillium dahliae]
MMKCPGMTSPAYSDAQPSYIEVARTPPTSQPTNVRTLSSMNTTPSTFDFHRHPLLHGRHISRGGSGQEQSTRGHREGGGGKGNEDQKRGRQLEMQGGDGGCEKREQD